MTPTGWSSKDEQCLLHVKSEESKQKCSVHLVVLCVPLISHIYPLAISISTFQGASFYIIFSCKQFPFAKVGNLLLSLKASTEYEW